MFKILAVCNINSQLSILICKSENAKIFSEHVFFLKQSHKYVSHTLSYRNESSSVRTFIEIRSYKRWKPFTALIENSV